MQNRAVRNGPGPLRPGVYYCPAKCMGGGATEVLRITNLGGPLDLLGALPSFRALQSQPDLFATAPQCPEQSL